MTGLFTSGIRTLAFLFRKILPVSVMLRRIFIHLLGKGTIKG